MAVETANFINELVAANPLGSDSLDTADNHLRLIKTCLDGSFPAFLGVAVTATEAQINDVVNKALDADLTTEIGIRAAADTALDVRVTEVEGALPTISSGSPVTATPAELNIMDGVTATTAELNIMDGVTASAADISALAGVGSFNGLVNAVIPAGIIQMWAGTIATIPAGYYLCDGSNGTPNLVERFLMGTSSNPVAYAGYGNTSTFAAAGGAIGARTSGSTALTVAQMPAHTHTMYATSGGTIFVAGGTGFGASGTNVGATASNGSGAGHTHTLPAVSAHTHTIDIATIRHFKMAFIQKYDL